jgi:DNA-binding response OmpR family regulator
MKILIVEDDARVADFLLRGLRAEGYLTAHARTGEEALEQLRMEPHALVLLDVMLPGMSGIEVCQQLRAAREVTPVLMLTAMGSVQDRVLGLRCGADDYLTKPFAFDELLARIEALTRRAGASLKPRDPVLTVGAVQFHRERMEVTRDGSAVPMTARELALLELLMSAPGRLFSRERILSNVWGVDEDPLTNVVDVYIRRLRSKLDPPEGPSLIRTVRGLGYRLEAPSAGA